MAGNERREAAARAAERIAELNIARDDDFQDNAMGEIRRTLEAFRPDPEAELPAPGEDPLVDALMKLAGQLDASQEAVNASALEVLELAGQARGAEAPTT